MNNYKLYKHVNKINGKVYIGITKQTLNRRFREGDGYKSCTHINRAIKKYGWEKFITEVICENLDFETACYMEIEYIKQHNSNDKNFGYNISKGGQNQDGIPEETRIKISNSLTGKKATEETKIKMSKSRKGLLLGEKNPMYGKGFKGEDNPMFGMKRGKCPNSKKVKWVNGIFDCVQDCADYFGVGYSSMRAYLNGQRKMPKKLADLKLMYVIKGGDEKDDNEGQEL